MKRRFNLTGVIFEKAFNALSNPIINCIESQLFYEVDISTARFCVMTGLEKAFKNLPQALSCNICESSDSSNDLSLKYSDRLSMPVYEGLGYTGIVIYKKTPIVLSYYVCEGDKFRGKTQMCLKTFNTTTHIANLKEFIQKIAEYTSKQYDIDNSFTIFKCDGNFDIHEIAILNIRDFSNVFIPKEQKDLLLNTVESFISNRSWYIKNNIPNHMGILLYGTPGSGKTSIAQALAKHINADLFIVSGDNIMDIDDIIQKVIGQCSCSSDKYRVLLIEDIDCGFVDKRLGYSELKSTKTDDSDDTKTKAGMASVLNALDGIGAPSNIIYIFTTNHIEKLDPALIRPGRIDLKLNIDYVCLETFIQFCKFHYGENVKIPKTLKIKDGITFGELQVEVMKRKTIKEMISYVRKVDEKHEN